MFVSSHPAGPGAAPDRRDDERRSRELVRRLRATLVAEGGFTVDVRTCRPVLVGLAVCADPSRTLQFRLTEWSDPVVHAWLSELTAHHCRSGPREPLYIGGWHPPSGEIVHLDVVRVVPPERRHVAELLGRRHRQHAMFDLGRRALLPLAAT